MVEEQVNVVEEDIAQLYENWFIETCDDWVVPYIGDLIGWQQVHEAGEPASVAAGDGRARNKILIPRRELETIRYRRRKGTLALLELLAYNVAGWHARAVEFFRLLGYSQNINLSHIHRGGLVDVRAGSKFASIDTAFEELPHTVDIRRISSNRASGRYNISSVGLFVGRLKSYPVTLGRAHCAEDIGPDCFTFSVLGNDAPLLHTSGARAGSDDHRARDRLAGARFAAARSVAQGCESHCQDRASDVYYGDHKSVSIWVRRRRHDPNEAVEREIIPANRIIPADLSGWNYRPRNDRVAVDPVLGRIVFPAGHCPKDGVWVSYHYGFSADIGGGEYDRPLSQPEKHKLYRVGPLEKFHTINAALRQWRKNDAAASPNAVIEIVDSGVYVEQINIHLKKNQSLQLRAANAKRPVLRLLDWHTDSPDALSISGEHGSRFTLDGSWSADEA